MGSKKYSNKGYNAARIAEEQEAEEKANRTWEEMRGKLQQFVDQQAFLQELLNMVSGESK